MKRLFFDTETTGLWLFKEPVHHPDQPSIVQLAGLLYDEEDEVGSFNMLVKDGYSSIHPKAQEVHGISKEKAELCGLSLKSAYGIFAAFASVADIIIAHNYAFDSKLIAKAADACGKMNILEEKESFCTMAAATDFCAIQTAYGKYKWPKLSELHKKLFNVEFEDAHDAMGDITATKDCYFEMKVRGII